MLLLAINAEIKFFHQLPTCMLPWTATFFFSLAVQTYDFTKKARNTASYKHCPTLSKPYRYIAIMLLHLQAGKNIPEIHKEHHRHSVDICFLSMQQMAQNFGQNFVCHTIYSNMKEFLFTSTFLITDTVEILNEFVASIVP